MAVSLGDIKLHIHLSPHTFFPFISHEKFANTHTEPFLSFYFIVLLSLTFISTVAPLRYHFLEQFRIICIYKRFRRSKANFNGTKIICMMIYLLWEVVLAKK